MTTTISKQEQQQQQHLQQQQQQHLQQQQQYVQLQQQALLTSDSVAIPIAADLQFDTLNNNNQNNNTGSPDQALPSNDEPQKRRSLLNFKSLDYHLKSLYSGLRSNSGTGTPPSQPNTSIPAVDVTQRRMPYLRVESVDPEEPRGSVIHHGHSPSFLSPYSGAGASGVASLQLPSSEGGTIRRSSTSDIVNCRRGGGAGGSGGSGGGGAASAQDSRRPSTSDLLRKARERKGSEARMGRSVSHSGLTRGGPGGGGGGLGGRRTSMAF